ncbi:MAG: c-type cytochrome [Steroidobacteraceae bacterium]
MKRWIKRSIVGTVSVLAVAAGLLGVAIQIGYAKMNRVVKLPAYPISLRDDAASIERGHYLFESRGCSECHGANGGGTMFIRNDAAGLHITAPNISPGPGNVVAKYRAEDWERTLRHGVKPNGRPLFIMPAEDFSRFTDDDIAAVVAYVRHLPPVPGGRAAFDLPLVLPALYAVGLFKDAAEKIDHTLPPAKPVREAVTAEHGRYVVQGCQGCHGPNLSGGKVPGAPPDWPASANLTPGEGSVMPRYASPDAFKAMLRSGRRPDHSEVSKVMPFASLSKLSDVDIAAVYLYLKSLPPRGAGGR